MGGARRSVRADEHVRADIDRLREPQPLAAPQGRSIVAASFALPLAVLALWPPTILLHGAIDLVRLPLRYYEMMPGLALRRMDASEALAQLLVGGALLTIFSTIAYAIPIGRAVTQPVPRAHAPEAFSRFFGGIFFGASIGQLASAWMEEGAWSAVLGYAALALGGLVGVFGWGALFALVARVREREQKEQEA